MVFQALQLVFKAATLVMYGMSFMLLCLLQFKKNPTYRLFFVIALFLGLIFHAVLLHQWIDVKTIQNLAFANWFSLTAWMITLLLGLVTLKQKENLTLFFLILPITWVSVIMVPFFESYYWMDVGNEPKHLVHVLLALLTFSVLALSALQAFFLAGKRYFLNKKHRLIPITDSLPLEQIEIYLFQWLALGFILLTVLLISSFFSFEHPFSSRFLSKSFLAICAWIIFAALLLGRYLFGWRGQKAIYSTLVGFMLLLIIYYGSEILQGWSV